MMKLCLIVATLLLGSTAARAQPPPSDEEAPSRWTDTKLPIGAALLGGGYAYAAIWSWQTGHGRDELFVPVLGPWLELFSLPDCPRGDMYCKHENVALLALDGVTQAVGTAMLGSWLVGHRKPTERGVAIAPSAQTGGPGVLVVGRF